MTAVLPPGLRLREMRPGDVGFVVDTWAQSFYGARAVRGMTSESYFQAMHALIKRIVARSAVIVACDEEDEDSIAGWACIEDDCLHYVFVRLGSDERGRFRGLGIARAMVEPFRPACYSHHAPGLKSVPDGWAYEPFRAWCGCG